MNTLKGIVEQTNNEKDSEGLAGSLILIGKALSDQGKFADSKECLELACTILDKKETVSPRFVAQACADVATVYEAMDEIETAVSLLKRALALIEKEPQELHAEGTVSARIGWMLLSGGEVPPAIPYLESAAERLKESFASKHFVAGHNYNNLGVAYLESERPQLAAQMFATAKDNLDVYRGPHHPDSIVARQNLAIAYNTVGSYTLAIESQQQVINHGISEDVIDENLNVAEESHAMPGLEKKEREYSKDPNRSCKQYTNSYAYPMEDFHYWRKALTHPCHPLEKCVPEKPTTHMSH
ncbi:hypothetical protein PTKIN_Ptkin15bG0116800 [Pterospermum kingtungense]